MAIDLKKNKLTGLIWDYLVITFGSAMYTFAWSCMFIPNGVASGGVTGASTIINFATGIPVYISYIVINVILLLMGFLILGKSFGLKTIFAIAISTVFLDFFASMESWYLFFESRLLLVLVATLLESIGIALILEVGGSTGGTDIIALIVNKFWPITVGRVYLATDLFIIASILLIPGKTVEDMVYGYVAMFMFSVMVDWVMLGRKSTWQVMVFSDEYKAIADYIINNMNRGVTALNSVGWYTGNDKKVLLIIVRKRELHDLTKLIKAMDPKAFVSVSAASTVYGEGFDEIKTGVNIRKKKKENEAIEQKKRIDND